MNGVATVKNASVYLKILDRLFYLEINWTIFYVVETPIQNHTVGVRCTLETIVVLRSTQLHVVLTLSARSVSAMSCLFQWQ